MTEFLAFLLKFFGLILSSSTFLSVGTCMITGKGRDLSFGQGMIAYVFIILGLGFLGGLLIATAAYIY
tara:strand:+ start:858 stop:1061 length:204 start_codon:yes stop_codon:yes gene_type:complete